MAQSVIDELENLDLDGAIRKRGVEDDDFDYVNAFIHYVKFKSVSNISN
jgi:hypothetical protein